jgi:hypothetical protein
MLIAYNFTCRAVRAGRLRFLTSNARGTMLTRKAKLFLSLTAAVPLLFAAACTDNGIFNPLADAAGTYQLTVYAGKSLTAHYVIQPNDPDYPSMPNGGTLDVTDGSLVLNSNGTYTEINNYIVTPSGQSSVNQFFRDQGTWDLNGTDLTLSSQQANRFVTGTLDVDTINYQEPDGNGGFDSFEYKR